jgi:hypothetical protein
MNEEVFAETHSNYGYKGFLHTLRETEFTRLQGTKDSYARI